MNRVLKIGWALPLALVLQSCGGAKFLGQKSAGSGSKSGVSTATSSCDLAKFQPSFVSATPGDSTVTLQWEPRGDATPIIGYFGRYWEGDDYTNSPPNPPLGKQGNGNPLAYFPANQDIISATSYTVTGLENGKTYTFAIVAKEPTRCGYGWEVYTSATPEAP